MPIITCPVQEHADHIFQPILRQLTYRLVDMLDLRDVVDDKVYIESDWSTHSRTSTIEKDAIVDPNRFKVEGSVQLNPTSVKWEVYTFEHTAAYGITPQMLNVRNPIYYDKDNSVRIVEFFSPVNIVMNCTITVQSADIAYRLPAMIFNRFDTGAVVQVNDLLYDYQVPKHILTVLKRFWDMDRRKGKPAGVSFVDYIMKNTQGTWQRNFNRNKVTEKELIVPKNDMCTLGEFSYTDDRPNVVKQDRLPSGYELNFTYTAQFGIPTILILDMPCVYNNQLVPSYLIPRDTHDRWNQMPESLHNRFFEKVKNTELTTGSSIIKLPFYDDWFIPNDSAKKAFNLHPVAIISLLVDENEDLSTTADLSQDLDEHFGLKPLVKEILYQEGTNATDYDTIYNIRVYRDDTLLYPQVDYTFDSDLIVRFKARNLHDHYRLVLSKAMNLTRVNIRYWWMLAQYFDYLPVEMKRAVPNLLISKHCTTFLGDDYWYLVNGEWKKIKLTGNLKLGEDGYLYRYDDLLHKWIKMTKFSATTFPYANPAQLKLNRGEESYGYYTGSRIVHNTIRTHRS